MFIHTETGLLSPCSPLKLPFYVLDHGNVISRHASVSTFTPPSDTLLVTVIPLFIVFYIKESDGHLYSKMCQPLVSVSF